jgi:hypothetical protein
MAQEKTSAPAAAKELPKGAATRSPYSMEVTLPSRGKFYGNALPDGKVWIRPITVAEEKLFASNTNATDIADRVLARCIESECISLQEMLQTDKYYLLLTLRSLSYGSDYPHKIKCRCGKEYVHKMTVPDGLMLKMATETDVEPFEVDLPMVKKKVTLRFLRGKDEDLVDQYIAQLEGANANDGDPGYGYRLSLHIVAIDGAEPSSLERLRFVESMHGRDSQTIRRAISVRETGVDLTLKAVCPFCQAEFETLLTLTREFFRPNVS